MDKRNGHVIQKKVEKFMNGRNGTDQLSNFLLLCAFSLLIATVVISSVSSRNATIIAGLQGIALALLMLSYARVLSRNLQKRRRENMKYLQITAKARGRFYAGWRRLKMRRNYKLFVCPGCKTVLRVPKGKGRINLTCPKCHARFEGKS